MFKLVIHYVDFSMLVFDEISNSLHPCLNQGRMICAILDGSIELCSK